MLEKPLLEYIRGSIRKKYCPISIRLMVLGRCQDDAKPCIVVLCPEQQSKKVRKFFDKKSVRALRLPEDGQPSFEVFVIGRAPELKQADGDIDVLIPIVGESEGYTNETYCGAPIVIRQTSGVDKRCTFGGVIKATWSNGEVKLYGLTVGHVLLSDLADDLTVSTESDQARCSDDWEFELSDSDSEDESVDMAEEEPEDEAEPLCVMDELQLGLADGSASWTALDLGKIGSISKDFPQYQSTAIDIKYGEPQAYYDWALIDMINCKPNLIRPRKLPHGQEDGAFKSGNHELVVATSPPSSHGERQSVVLVSGSEGLKRGSLSALPSRLLLGPGQEFVDALILNLDNDKQILDGDSGSWVINESTLEVYGYVVAADAFGGGYIIPLVEAFSNITDTLRCQSVDLATTIDMASAKLESIFDMNASILAGHSALQNTPIFSFTSTPTTHLSIASNISCASTPATSLSMTSNYDGPLSLVEYPEDHFMFPTFSQEKPFVHPEIHPDDDLDPPPSPKTGGSYTVWPVDHKSSDDGFNKTSRPGTPEVTVHAEDDSAVSSKPSRHVDYLSHEWKEEDIWSSWRYIVTRRGEFEHSGRLENASWRTWMKVKYKLKAVSPETINWLKDCDVTWLYGPLQSRTKPVHDAHTEVSSDSLSKTDSLANLNKKPILKKRSMSKVMLQRTISNASLLKQAAAAVQTQEARGIMRPSNSRRGTVDYFAYPFSSSRMGDESRDPTTSTESSGITSPRKHIHFNEQVEQYMAVDVKGMEVDSDCYGDDGDSDDDVMLKRVKPKKQSILKKRVAKSKSTEGKIIAKLPSTALKYREDTPEAKETAMKYLRSPPLSPSSSQETLRPAKSSVEFFLDDEEEEEALDDALLSPPRLGHLPLPR
uniref:Nitrogen regulatory protein areA GATA-like domain-containing protein n=1 Tax=Bionectria ochroleuca TaxID=29856 RepID=A0A8H7NKV0_BIOOC